MALLDGYRAGWPLAALSALGLVAACGSKEGPVLLEPSHQSDAGARSSDAGAPPRPTSSVPETHPTDSSVPAASDAGNVVRPPDTAPATSLPALPPLENVVAVEHEDSVGIDFDPVDDAVDYRVYELPSDGDVSVHADGSLAVKNATYRCAGLRQTFHVPTNLNSHNSGNGVFPTKPGVVFASVYPSITAEVPDQPLLGYVYTAPSPDRVPVYAVGTYPSGGEAGWRESRAKIYTSDETERRQLLAANGRDDGIVFYVPKAASTVTQTLYRSANVQPIQDWMQHTQYYFLGADMGTHEKDGTPPAPAFEILKDASQGTRPLYAVFYQPNQPHTELSVGKARFDRAANQGPGPLWHLEWSGLTAPTTLVVEALAGGCPYQGFLSPSHLDAPPHQAFLTLDELRRSSPTGEVYVNGQYDVGESDGGASLFTTPTASPVPIARAFVKVTPHPHDPALWDWYEGFATGTSLPAESMAPDPKFANDGTSSHVTSSLFDFGAYSMDNPNNVLVQAHGTLLGQFWDAFDDWKQDVTGRLRFTAQKSATIDADASKFLHVTWTVNTVGTGRRYPQLIVSDQTAPIEDGFQNPDGNFLIVQTIQGPSMRLDAEAFHGLINGSPWAVNNQPTAHGLVDVDTWNSGTSSNGTIPPAEPPLEHAGMDRMTHYDAYLSAGRLYVLVDGKPAACTELPGNGFSLKGTVSVTFGDVLYHEGAETEVGSCAAGALTSLPFLNRHQCTETARHWDDLGFKSGVAAPSWDESRFPCVAY